MSAEAPEGPPDGAHDDAHDAIEQVQLAVLTAIGAARVALDAVEALVADRSRLEALATNGRDLVGTVRSSFTGWCADAGGDAAADPTDDPGDPGDAGEASATP